MNPTIAAASAWQDYLRAPRLTDATPPSFEHPVSQTCTQSQIESLAGGTWFTRLGLVGDYRLHRKVWELIYVCQVLDRFELLTPGRRGLVFGVGQDRLPYLFASMGVDVLASDLATDAAADQGWVQTNQHGSDLKPDLFPNVCSPEVFSRHVTYRDVDMNAIDADLCQGEFDFCWSCCSLEHVGSMELAIQFILNSLKTLKPGGIAVHTTEFNLTSDVDTLMEGPTVLFRKRDLLELQRRAEAAGWVLRLNLHTGDMPVDQYIDVPPFELKHPHLKLQLGQFATTSVGLILCREDVATPPR